jgi:hypothetical protein
MAKLKTAADVPTLVDALIAESPEVMAVGDDSYVVVAAEDDEANRRIEQILNEFGPRDHLFKEIIAALQERGRDYYLNPVVN